MVARIEAGGAAVWGAVGRPASRAGARARRRGEGRAKPDFHWPSHALIVETDGWQAHHTPAAFRADRAKDAALTTAGYEVLRFTWDVHDATILRRLNAVLG